MYVKDLSPLSLCMFLVLRLCFKPSICSFSGALLELNSLANYFNMSMAFFTRFLSRARYANPAHDSIVNSNRAADVKLQVQVNNPAPETTLSSLFQWRHIQINGALCQMPHPSLCILSAFWSGLVWFIQNSVHDQRILLRRKGRRSERRPLPFETLS